MVDNYRPRIGVYICHCGINIGSVVDVDAVVEHASKLPGVVVSRNYSYMCSDPGQGMIKEDIREGEAEPRHRRFMLAPDARADLPQHAQGRGAQPVLPRDGQHPRAVLLGTRGQQRSRRRRRRSSSRRRSRRPCCSRRSRRRRSTSIPSCLIIGAGIAGIQAALDIADAGFKVYLVEKSPSVGGHMAQLDKTFPTLDCSACILTPKMVDVANHPNIELMTYSQVEEVEGYVGNFKAKIRKKARFVDFDKCTGCGDCAEACRLAGRIPSEFDESIGNRSAIYLPFPQAVPAGLYDRPGALPAAIQGEVRQGRAEMRRGMPGEGD